MPNRLKTAVSLEVNNEAMYSKGRQDNKSIQNLPRK
jgi:hypothetical protein